MCLLIIVYCVRLFIYDNIMLYTNNANERFSTNLHYLSKRDFALTISNLINDTIIVKELAIKGKKIDFAKTQLPINNTTTDKFSFRYPYTHPDTEFIQSAEHAELLRNMIMERYPEDTKSSTVQWRGDLKLGVSKNFELENRFKEKELYNCTYSKISVQGGMRQETKGVLIKDMP